ncbi:MAG: recombinase family protein [Clostridia bacterium]|nr:recombinase family protein [Clostridia bacterium]
MAKKKQAPAETVAAVYARYSSHAQNDASIEQQVAECREYAAAHDLKICEIYADRALSGRSDRRPEFQKMIRHAEAGKFQVVLTYKSNRIARNMLDALRYEDRLEKAGVKVVYCKENFGDNAAGRMAVRMMMSLNEFYSENMAEDIKRGMNDSAQQCKIVGSIPFGYRRGEDGRFAIDEANAEVVREIFRRYAEGDTQAAIADDLNARRILTQQKRPWGKNSFHTILTNERYIGVYIFADIRVENGMPAIIDRDLFYRVQEKVGRRREVAGRRRESIEYLLTGKLFCAKCGAPMVGVSGTGKGGSLYYYYVCKNRQDHHTCKKRNVRKAAAEREIAARLKSIVLKPDVVEWMIDNVMRYQDEARKQSDLASYQDRLVEVRRSLDNLVKAIEAGVFSQTTKARLDDLETEQRELQAMIAMERSKINTVTRDQIAYYLESFRDGDVDDPAYQKRLFKAFLVKAFLDDDKFRIVYNYADGLDTLEFPLTLEDIESSDISPECSYNSSLGVPKASRKAGFIVYQGLEGRRVNGSPVDFQSPPRPSPQARIEPLMVYQKPAVRLASLFIRGSKGGE